MNNSKRIYRAAIYVRLSKEDGDLDDVRKAESNSISNQKSLILNYLKDKEDIEIVSIREDDGYSGATFDRPAFKLMMQDVKDGIIDCIVVKDLSRFAREYIDAGRYIERMFPAMGIRFIAINDAYDSADTQAQGNEIIIPFKNLINDAYCRDISIKIRSHLETKRQNGEFVGNYCVYGYKKSEIDHNVIVPDEYAGPVVQDIFHWIKNGMSLDAISDKLNALGILSPMAYKLSKGENYKTAFQKKDELLWTPVAVRRIATNIIYTGTLVQGKITTPNHKVKTRILKPQEKWAVCHNNHEALVSLRTFQIVQRLLSVDMRMAPGKDSIYLLSGIAVCADCGALMTRKVSTVNGKKYVYYMCSNNKKNKKCSSHRIKEADLESRVFDTLREMTATLLDADEVIKEAGNNANFRIDQKKTKERISAKEKEITKYNQMLITKEQFYAVQKNKRKVIKPAKKQTVNMLKGKITCGCCGSSIHIHPEKYGKVYMCTHRKRYGKDSCNCLPVKVDDIYAAVLAVIKEQIQVFIDREKILKEHHNDSSVIRQEQVYTEAVNKCVKEMDRLMELKSGLYADYTEDLLDEKEYLQLNREYSQRIEKLKIQADEYRQAASQYESAEKTVAQLKAEMLRFKGKRKLTQEMVDLFVAQVRIYENKNLEIVLNYEDELKKFAELNMEREAG